MATYRACALVLCSLLVCLVPIPICRGEETPESRLIQMRQRAESTKILFVEPQSADVPVSLIPTPLNRYSDQPREIADATFWCWESGGRPVAFEKVEFYRRRDSSTSWFYCFASASPKRIRAEWDVGENWAAAAPGVKLQPLPDERVPAGNELRLSFQMKQISRRFSVRLRDEIAETEEQLRLVPHPIYEYGRSRETSVQGAVFRFASNGTNPDALLMIEMDRSESEPQWRYGWIQMTTGKLTARLDDQVVWTAPYHSPSFGRPAKFDTWLFFHESSAGR